MSHPTARVFSARELARVRAVFFRGPVHSRCSSHTALQVPTRGPSLLPAAAACALSALALQKSTKYVTLYPKLRRVPDLAHIANDHATTR